MRIRRQIFAATLLNSIRSNPSNRLCSFIVSSHTPRRLGPALLLLRPFVPAFADRCARGSRRAKGSAQKTGFKKSRHFGAGDWRTRRFGERIQRYWRGKEQVEGCRGWSEQSRSTDEKAGWSEVEDFDADEDWFWATQYKISDHENAHKVRSVKVMSEFPAIPPFFGTLYLRL